MPDWRLVPLPRPPDWTLDWPAIEQALPVLATLRGCAQDPVFHAEGDVAVHTAMVTEALVALPGWRARHEADRHELLLAALLHDVGKPACSRTDEHGRITTRGHSRLGASIARDLLWRAGAPVELREAVARLIRVHQEPWHWTARGDPQRLVIELSWILRNDRLRLLAEADARGRTAQDLPQTLETLRLFGELAAEEGCLDRPWPFASDHARFLYFRKEGRRPDAPGFDDTRCRVTVMSGLPGAGKDTWLARHEPGLPSVSLDALRAELGVDPTDDQGRLIQEARERARVHLRAGRDFAWNATCVTRRQRSAIIGLAADYGARVRIVQVEAGADELEGRNRGREVPVPWRVIVGLVRKWEPPDPPEAQEVVISGG